MSSREHEEKLHPGNRQPEKEAHVPRSTWLMKRTEKFVGGLFMCVQHSSSARKKAEGQGLEVIVVGLLGF